LQLLLLLLLLLLLTLSFIFKELVRILFSPVNKLLTPAEAEFEKRVLRSCASTELVVDTVIIKFCTQVKVGQLAKHNNGDDNAGADDGDGEEDRYNENL
jgi:hypothetical protein